MGGYSESEKQNMLRNTIYSMTLGTFVSKFQLEQHIRRILTDDEKNF